MCVWVYIKWYVEQHQPMSDIYAYEWQVFMWQGDIQTAVSMLIVLGDHVRSHIDMERQEDWFLSYIGQYHSSSTWTL